MAMIPESHRYLLDEKVAMLATIGPDGFRQVTALWFLYDENDQTVKLYLNNTRQKVKNLERDPKCSLLIIDHANTAKTLEIRARANLQSDPNYALADRLVGGKYGANVRQMDPPGTYRLVITLEPVKVIATDVS